MDGDPHILEQSLTARERALQEKIVRLEKKLEGYQSQIGNTSYVQMTSDNQMEHCLIFLVYSVNASVNSTCAHPPPPGH